MFSFFLHFHSFRNNQIINENKWNTSEVSWFFHFFLGGNILKERERVWLKCAKKFMSRHKNSIQIIEDLVSNESTTTKSKRTEEIVYIQKKTKSKWEQQSTKSQTKAKYIALNCASFRHFRYVWFKFISKSQCFYLHGFCYGAIYLQVKIVIFQIQVLKLLEKSCICGILTSLGV